MNRVYVRWAIIWAVNSLVIYAASSLYPANIVLGTYRISPLAAAALTGFLITVFCRGASVFLRGYVNRYLKGRYGMFVFYWGVNAVLVWLIARVAPVTGFGISGFYWALGLGFVLSLSQWLTRQGLKLRKQ